jgi:23S rRNA (cytosine1962-C5)-methyltransferase
MIMTTASTDRPASHGQAAAGEPAGSPYPTIKIARGHDRRQKAGSPWLFSNELKMDDAAKALPAGSTVRLMAPTGKIMGVAHFNPHSLIAARVLTRNKDAVIDRAFLERRIARALALREKLYDRPFYRLVHAEGDGLPGLVVDRYGDLLVVQLNTAGMAAMEAEVAAALESVLGPVAILARNDSPGRSMEGLAEETHVIRGTPPDRVTVEENGLAFVTEPAAAQKTGWYYDQSMNRAFAARLAKGARVLDLYAYAGGFALTCLAHGARSALAVDRSATALALAEASAAGQGVADRFATRTAEVFPTIEALAAEKARFDVVIADPPAFVRARKDLAVGLRGYRKLARDASGLVAEAGFFVMACCSHNVSLEAFTAEVTAGIRAAGRGARQIYQAGAAPDHPIHPALPETAYLKCVAYALD